MSLIMVLKVSATAGIVSTRIGSMAITSAGCPWASVVWIPNRHRGTGLNVWSGNHSHSSPTIPGKLLWAKTTHSSRVFPHKMDRANRIATSSVTNLKIITAATEVIVISWPISSATSAPGISPSQTHLLRMNHIGQTWCARNWFHARPGIEYLCPRTRSAVDWRIR